MKTLFCISLITILGLVACKKESLDTTEVPLTYPDNIVGSYQGLMSGTRASSSTGSSSENHTYTDSLVTIEIQVYPANDLVIYLPDGYNVTRTEVTGSTYAFTTLGGGSYGQCSDFYDKRFEFNRLTGALSISSEVSTSSWFYDNNTGANQSSSNANNFTFEGTKQ